jgi:hypothetical protein
MLYNVYMYRKKTQTQYPTKLFLESPLKQQRRKFQTTKQSRAATTQTQDQRNSHTQAHISTRLSVELLVELVQSMHITLRLCADSTDLESNRSLLNTLLKLLNALDSDILERVLKTSLQVGNKLGNRTTVQDRSGDTLCNTDLVTLREVTTSSGVVGRLLALHSINGSHTTVSLDKLSVRRQEVLSGGLGSSGKKSSHHNSAGSKSNSLNDVTNVLDSSVGDTRNTEATGKLANGVNSGSLGTSNSHNLLGDTSRSRSHSDTETVGTGGDEVGGLLAGNDVSGDDLEVGEGGLDPLQHADLVEGVTLGRVHDDNVESGLDELVQTGLVVLAGSDGGSAKKLLGVGELRGEREVEVLHEVGAGEESGKVAGGVDDGELALLGGTKEVVGRGEGDSLGGGDKVGGHDFGEGSAVVVVELDIAHGDDSDKLGVELSILWKMLLAAVTEKQLKEKW